MGHKPLLHRDHYDTPEQQNAREAARVGRTTLSDSALSGHLYATWISGVFLGAMVAVLVTEQPGVGLGIVTCLLILLLFYWSSRLARDLSRRLSKLHGYYEQVLSEAATREWQARYGELLPTADSNVSHEQS